MIFEKGLLESHIAFVGGQHYAASLTLFINVIFPLLFNEVQVVSFVPFGSARLFRELTIFLMDLFDFCEFMEDCLNFCQLFF